MAWYEKITVTAVERNAFEEFVGRVGWEDRSHADIFDVYNFRMGVF